MNQNQNVSYLVLVAGDWTTNPHYTIETSIKVNPNSSVAALAAPASNPALIVPVVGE